MKISIKKRIWFILCCGIFIVGLAGLGVTYLSQAQEQKQLSEKLTSVESQIAGISVEDILAKQSADKDRIAQYEAQVAATQTRFSVPLVVSDIFQDLLSAASSNSVSMTDVSSSAKTDAEIGGLPYRALTLDFAVTGSALSIYNFVDRVSQTFTTGVVKTLRIEIIGDSIKGSKAYMRLTVYSFEGEKDE